ncbi:MAG: glycosyltransferase family 4 protein [Rhodospirillaceae bacterium]|jgi:colanic acid biosynthesis glycosyl transferase WcaI|nr:glycosyltransferase family 4 protein [Rhodospirillaceae bacterium]
MKILFLTENFPPETNAAATRVYERACYWAKWGHEVTILTCAPNFPEGRLYDGYRNSWRSVEEMDGLRIVRVKTYMAANRGTVKRMLDFLSFMVSAFGAGLFERRPDIIAATSPQFFAAVGGWALGAVRRVPFVFELGDLWPASIVAVGAMRPSLGLRLMEKLELFLYRRAAAVVALTHAFKQNLVERGIDADKINVVINGVDTWRYGPRERDTDLATETGLAGKFVVGYVGTHGMAHALSNVLDAAEQLADTPAIAFLLAGGGAERDDLVAEAKRRGLENVIFLERQPKDRMPAVWSLCDVALVHLKNSDVFRDVIPSKMFEAMAMGLPVLMASPAGEASEILEKDDAGLHVPAEDPAALADAVRRLHQEPSELKRLAAASLAAAPSHSREAQARDMMAALQRVGGEAS